MRVLLDENLPRKLKWRLEGVEAMTVPMFTSFIL
jgi:hypothetical protein